MSANKIFPGQTIGILGGGQLGRMMATAAKHMGYRIAVLDPTPDCPTAQVADHHIIANFDDMKGIKQLAEVSDTVTYEFENVDLTAARFLEENSKLPQGANLLEVTQDRENEKKVMVESGLPVASFAIVHDKDEFLRAAQDISFPFVVKTCRGGYDGKGQLKVENESELASGIAFVEKHKRIIVEQWVPFDKEVSVLFTRTAAGNTAFFPVAENKHKDHILDTTIAPARVSDHVKQKALKAAQLAADAIGVVGTFAIEMFVRGDEIYINEMAPRPHNSGHYTIEACTVSQFEQHIRAICGLPLLPVEFIGAAKMVNLLGEDVNEYLARITEIPSAHFHIYGKKEAKAKRKMGHLTFVARNLDELERLTKA